MLEPFHSNIQLKNESIEHSLVRCLRWLMYACSKQRNRGPSNISARLLIQYKYIQFCTQSVSVHFLHSSLGRCPKVNFWEQLCSTFYQLNSLPVTQSTLITDDSVSDQGRIKGGARGAAAPGPAISRGPHFWEVQKINS